MKKRIFLTPLAILFGLLCLLLVMTPIMWTSDGNLTVTMDKNNNTALTMMAKTVNNDSIATVTNTGSSDLLLVSTAVTLNEEKNRLFTESTLGLPSQVDVNNNLTCAGNETDVLEPDVKGLAKNGDSNLKMLMLSSCKNFEQIIEETAVANSNNMTGTVIALDERNFENGGGSGNSLLAGSAAALVVATFDGALRAKIPKAAAPSTATVEGTNHIAS